MTTRGTDFWDRRFDEEGALWGTQPAPSAISATSLFRGTGVKRVLVSGCAYGRHALHFAREGFDVVGLDASDTALELARQAAPDEALALEFVQGDVCSIPLPDGSVDAIYERALLHLLLAAERAAAIAEYRRVLRSRGLLFITAFSVYDAECGDGEEVEPGTYDAKGGRPAHFFTERDLCEQLDGFDVIDVELVAEAETHGGQAHDHQFWWAIATKE
jgi:SAM-dependent methyltransferase